MARVTGLDAGTHQRFPAVDGRARALGDDFVDAFFVYGSVAFWRDKGETWDETRWSSDSRQRGALLTSALVALLVQTPEVDRNRPYEGRASGQRDIDVLALRTRQTLCRRSRRSAEGRT